MSHVNADSLQARGASDQSCGSISGRYFFKGKDELIGEQRSFFYVLWGAPSLWGDPVEIELSHDVANNTLKIKMHSRGYLRSEPRAEGTFQLSCLKGRLTYEYSGEGYSEDHNKWRYSFQFIKDPEGMLLVHAKYERKVSRFLFIWNEENTEQTTKFLPTSSER